MHVAANPVASTGDGACTQWEADKFFLRVAATSIHRRHARQTRDGLHGVVLAADAAAALADRPGASAAQRLAAAMANLAVREERAAAAAASHNARAALMEEHGERGTRWFHRQADEPAAGAQEHSVKHSINLERSGFESRSPHQVWVLVIKTLYLSCLVWFVAGFLSLFRLWRLVVYAVGGVCCSWLGWFSFL